MSFGSNNPADEFLSSQVTSVPLQNGNHSVNHRDNQRENFNKDMIMKGMKWHFVHSFNPLLMAMFLFFCPDLEMLITKSGGERQQRKNERGFQTDFLTILLQPLGDSVSLRLPLFDHPVLIFEYASGD